MKSRKTVENALSKHYSKKFKGKVWAMYDPDKRSYCIRGEQLPAATEMQTTYPDGWSLLDYIKPATAQTITERHCQ